MNNKEMIEKIAKLAFQFATLTDDEKIDERWFFLDNREKWFGFAETAIPIIQKNLLEELD